MDDGRRREILRFLGRIGVDTRFVSVTSGGVLINNLRFSRFSRRREETFRREFPDLEVVRSKVFQKICSRSSRILASFLEPRSRVSVDAEGELALALYTVLEPYTRKYGIVFDDEGIKARPETLDHAAAAVFEDMVGGEGIRNHYRSSGSIIYPFITVPAEWIESWLGTKIRVTDDPMVEDFMEFFSARVPQFREKLMKSLIYLDENSQGK